MHKNDLNVAAFTVPADEAARLKALGFVKNKTAENSFNVRVITRNGMISAEESRAITEAAEKFGNGKLAMSTRLTIEIQQVPYSNAEALLSFLAEHNLETGGTGAKVRPVVSCKGTTCQYGLIDTYSLSLKAHELFYKGYRDVKLPHKCKIAVGGCPNNCVKPNLNDIGIVGQRIVKRDFDLCRGCKKCQIEANCPIKICSVQDGKLAVDMDACNNCGRCMGKCPFHVTDEFENGYAIYIGGRWGKKVAHGQRIGKLFSTEEEVLSMVEKCILLFRDAGVPGERFADTIARIGFDQAEAMLLSDELLNRKEEILNK